MPAREVRYQGGDTRRIAVAPGHVVTGGERAPGASEHHHPHGIVHLRLRDDLDQVALHRLGHPVQPFWLIERDERDPAILQLP